MYNTYIRYFLVSLLLFGKGACYAATGQASVDPAIQGVAVTYFTALSSGDRQTLLSLLAEDALLRSKDQLQDPAYSQFLTDRYSNATLEIVGSGFQGNLQYVDIIIWMNDIESVRERLILRTIDSTDSVSYHIVSREEFGM